MPDLINLFQQLAQIDSISGEEKNISNYIYKYLKDLNCDPIQDENYMIYCKIGNRPNPILLSAHMDTVQPGKSIQIIEEDGYLKSAGHTILGGDNKISLATILFTVTKLIKEKKELNCELLFTVREETNSGIRDFDTEIIKSKVAFLFDGGNGDLSWMAKNAPTIEDVTMEIFGKDSHASRPEKGIDVLKGLISLNNIIPLGRLNKDTTFNLGLIKGGNSTNSVPSYLRLEGDLRSKDTKKYQKVKNSIVQAVTKELSSQNMKVIFHWEPYAFGYEHALKEISYKNLQNIYKSLDINLIPKSTTSGSDAGFLNKIGIKSYCLGDGVIDAHSINERIKIEKFYKLQEIVEKLILFYRK